MKKSKVTFIAVAVGFALAVVAGVAVYFGSGIGGPQPGDTHTVDLGDGVEMEFVWIPPGEYMRGGRLSPEETEERYGGIVDWYEDKHPRHRVRLTEGFWLGKTPVTQEQYEIVMGKKPSFFDGDDRPVESVSWHDAIKFTEKLSEQAEGTFRLPTEAEWEYACRAGTETEFYFGDDADRLGEYAWYWGNSNSRTHPVGQKRPNAWGLHDMHGNVWEWCADWYGEYPSGTVTDPNGPDSGSLRVLRGGSWINLPNGCLSSRRGRGKPDDRGENSGFRLAQDMERQ